MRSPREKIKIKDWVLEKNQQRKLSGQIYFGLLLSSLIALKNSQGTWPCALLFGLPDSPVELLCRTFVAN